MDSLQDYYDDIAPTVDTLTNSGDLTLVPRLHEAHDRFLDEGNDYGRDLIAGVLAGIAGVAALPALLLAAARDLGGGQDGLQAEINDLLCSDPAASRRMVLELAGLSPRPYWSPETSSFTSPVRSSPCQAAASSMSVTPTQHGTRLPGAPSRCDGGAEQRGGPDDPLCQAADGNCPFSVWRPSWIVGTLVTGYRGGA